MSDDFRASLAAEFDKIQAEESTDTPAVTEAAEDAVADVPAEESGRERDDKGRFVAAQKEEDTAASAEDEPQAQESPTDPDEKPAVEAEKPIDAPASWSADAKEAFAKLPPEMRQIVAKRESEREAFLTQKSQELASIKRQNEPLDQIISQRKQAWAMQGMDEARAISQLLALSDFAAEKPQEFIQWFAQQRGIQLPQPTQEGAAPAAPATPDFTPILNKVNSLEQTIQHQQQAEISRQIDAFKSGHEHFEDVRREMGVLMQHGLATDMEDAYQRACRANPSVWAKLQAAENAKADSERKAAEAKRIEEQKLAAARAKKAVGVTVAAKAAVGSPRAPAMSEREFLARQYDEIMGAA